jgi:amino acid transporter
MLLNSVWVSICIASGSFEQLLFFSAFGFWFFTGLTMLSVVRIRQKMPNLHRPFKAPGYPAVPYLLALFSICSLLGSFISQPFACSMSAVFIALSFPAYILQKRLSGPPCPVFEAVPSSASCTSNNAEMGPMSEGGRGERGEEGRAGGEAGGREGGEGNNAEMGPMSPQEQERAIM